MIIDCHGHYTTAPKPLALFRQAQIDLLKDPAGPAAVRPQISDDQNRATLEPAQLKLQRERGIDLALFSPGAGKMAHHVGTFETSSAWSRVCNDLIAQVCRVYPESFVGVCQLPQSPGADPAGCIPELERCITELGFVGCNLNPDPSGGYWTGPPMTERIWYPLYEKLVELDVPAMIHVAASCNPNFHGTGAHYINGDTSVFMQLLLSDLFIDFPTLRLIIPHGGGAVPYHWGRYRGLSLENKKRDLETLLSNVYFDTCVYHQPGVNLLADVIPAANVLFASEMVGAVKGKDPKTGQYFDDTRRYIDNCTFLSAHDKAMIFEGNARRVYPRLDAHLAARAPRAAAV
jgi:4-oxalmesaconate hydratase